MFFKTIENNEVITQKSGIDTIGKEKERVWKEKIDTERVEKDRCTGDLKKK